MSVSSRSRSLPSILVLLLTVSAVLPALAAPAAAVGVTGVKGTVRQPDGSPVVGAEVFAFASGTYPRAAGHAVTDASGAFTLSLPARAGSYQVSATDLRHLGAFAGGDSVQAARKLSVSPGLLTAGADVTLTPKPFRPVTAAARDIGLSLVMRPRLKGWLRVAGDRALWNDGNEIVLARGLASGTPSESVLASTSADEPADLGSTYAFVGAKRIDLASKASTAFSAADPANVSCDDSYVAMLFGEASYPAGANGRLQVFDVATGACKLTLGIPSETMGLYPGAVANGRVAFVSSDSAGNARILVYDIATARKLREIAIGGQEERSSASAVLAGNRLVWTDGSKLWEKDLAGAAATQTLMSVSDPRMIGSLAAGGDRVVDWRAIHSSTMTGDYYSDNVLEVRDFAASTVTTLFVEPEPVGSVQGGYDVTADHALWLEKSAEVPDRGVPMGGVPAVLGEEIWGSIDGGAPRRVDTTRLIRAEQSSPMISDGYVGWLDNGAYGAGLDQWDVYVAPASGAASPSLVETDVTGFQVFDVKMAGGCVIYTRPNGDMTSEIWAFDAATGTRRLLATDASDWVDAAGDWVVYSVDNPDWDGYALKALNVKTGAVRMVYQLSGVNEWGESFGTSGGMVFFQDAANVYWVYDPSTGKRLGKLPAGAVDTFLGAFDYPHLVGLSGVGGWASASAPPVSFATPRVRNVTTGEDFALDPFALFEWPGLGGDLLQYGSQLEDIQTGDWYQLPLHGLVPEDSAIEGHLVVMGVVDPADATMHLKTIDLTNDILPDTERFFGPTRYDTGVALSRDMTSAPAVVIATGRDFPDALAGVPLAHALHAPVLLTPPDALPASVAAEVRRLGAKTAYVLGSTKAVSATVDEQLETQGHVTNVVRLEGANRYETAAAVARRLRQVLGGAPLRTAFVATGRNFPDALAASVVAARLGAPILLTEQGYVPPATKAALSSIGATGTVVLGSPSVVSQAALAQLPRPLRIGGADRYETAGRIVRYGFDRHAFGGDSLVFAIGNDFPDAMGAGALAARRGVPLLLVNRAHPGVLPATIEALVQADKAACTKPSAIAGGEAALPLQLGERIAQSLR